METEPKELFEAAKKAADAAVDSSSEEDRCIDALKSLQSFPVNYQLLVSTQPGTMYEERRQSSEEDTVEIPWSKDLPRLEASSEGNVLACVDENGPEAKKEFVEIITFLKRSRIYKAITVERTPYYSHQRLFWETAQVVTEGGKKVIISSMNGIIVRISAQTIREEIGFPDDDTMPSSLHPVKVRRCLKRCGYAGDITKAVKRTRFCRQYRYLTYVLLRCLSPMKGGFDEMTEKYCSMFVALVLNAKFNFSEVIFDGMVLNVKRKSHLVFPRFMQIILDKQVAGLQKVHQDEIKQLHLNDQTFNRMMQHRKGAPDIPVKRLIGHLINPNYVCPEGIACRHEDSTSGTETDIKSICDEEVNQPTPPKKYVQQLTDEEDTTELNAEQIEALKRKMAETPNVTTRPRQKRLRILVTVPEGGSYSTTKSQPRTDPSATAAGGTNVVQPQTHQQTQQTQQQQQQQQQQSQNVPVTGASLDLATIGMLGNRLIQLSADFSQFQAKAAADQKKHDVEMAQLRNTVEKQKLKIEELDKTVNIHALTILGVQTEHSNLTKRLNEWEKKVLIEDEEYGVDGVDPHGVDPFGEWNNSEP
ncbi:uncharacterized protein [Rutidosis leptorrhynchoides]|uniref:uncharacterized protein n=1 Tax=Rutidosis leptorrhynchoides TaxID=125765 RepID=UPI003A99510D